MTKINISVAYEVSLDGYCTPKSVEWCDGRRWDITKVLHSCRTTKHSDMRYTVNISSRQKYLYYDDNKWYVTI